MSSILKALQKLERDTADSQGPHDPHRSLRQLVPRKMAGRSRGLLIRKAAFTTFAAVFLGAVSWALWHHPFPASRSTIEQTSRKTQRSAEPPRPASSTADRGQAPAPSPTESAPQKTVLSPSAGKDSESIAAAPPRSAGIAPNAPVALPPPQRAPVKPAVPAAKNRPRPHKAPAESKKTVAVSPSPVASGADAASVPVAKPLPPEPPPAAAPPMAAPVPTDVRKASRTMVDGAADTRRTTEKPPSSEPSGGRHEDLPVKTPDEAGLAIQALVWSAVPEDRLVVVNGNILKEGGAIEGASVAFIGEDYIIVRKDGARWKLKFQLK